LEIVPLRLGYGVFILFEVPTNRPRTRFTVTFTWDNFWSRQIARQQLPACNANGFEMTVSIGDEHASFLSSADLLCYMKDALETP